TITDGNGETSTATLTITVTGSNDGPSLVLSGSRVDDRAAGGTIIGDLSAIDADSTDTHTYAIEDDSSPFEIIGGQLVVKEGVTLNDKSGETIDVDITVTDSAGASTTKTFVIAVSDLHAETPVLNTVVVDDGVISELSGDGSIGNWQTDNRNGYIEYNPDYVYTGFDDGRGDVIELEANRGDASNLYQSLDIKAGDTIELSFDYSARRRHEGEDSQIDVYFEGELIDSITADQVGWETYTYHFTATTDNPTLEFKAPDSNSLGGLLDLIEVKHVHLEDEPVNLNIEVSLVDQDGSESISEVRIEGLLEGAVLTDGQNTFTASTNNDSVNVTDWDLDNISFQGAEHFHGEVSLTVLATSVEDSNGDTATASKELNFNIVPVNDPVVIDKNSPLEFDAVDVASFMITEAALLANASDADGDELKVSNFLIENAEVVTVIDPNTGEKSFLITPDYSYNGDLQVNFNVNDGNGSIVASHATLTISSTNSAPEANNDTGAVLEGAGATRFNVLVNDNDIDGDALTLVNAEVIEGVGSVSIDSNQVVFNPDISHNDLAQGETADVTVSYMITDGNGETTSASLSITVTGSNDGPTAQLNGSQVKENATGGTIVGDLSAIDPDHSDTHSYAVVDLNSPFEVLNGQLVVKQGANIDYEQATSIDVRIMVTDSSGASSIKTFTINVIDDLEENPKGEVITGGGGNDDLVGTEGNDEIAGGNGKDAIYGGGGDDIIDGGNSHDELYGGMGSDIITGGNGRDVIYGDEGDDAIDGGNSNDDLYGGDGNDTILGGGGQDYIEGGEGDDIINSGNGDDIIFGDEGNDVITAENGRDFINAGSGNDIIDGGLGSDTIFGDSGNDRITGGADNDTLSGGEGDDTFYYDGADGTDNVNGGNGYDSIDLTAVSGINTSNDFSLSLSAGRITASDGSKLILSDGAVGSIRLGDGTQININDIEEIKWNEDVSFEPVLFKASNTFDIGDGSALDNASSVETDSAIEDVNTEIAAQQKGEIPEATESVDASANSWIAEVDAIENTVSPDNMSWVEATSQDIAEEAGAASRTDEDYLVLEESEIAVYQQHDLDDYSDDHFA
ncbi:calcium-binding protein, partial [Marinagarivorans algicola]|uniref:calcium-binding protein n=1 Tax=Marinagarivorans algicola TaxID=1513270 RepID=UPI003735EC5A